MARLLVILALLLGHWSPAALAAPRPRAGCAQSRCCTIEVVRNCCGETVASHRCARSGGGPCRCAVRADDDAPSVPTAPPPAPETSARHLLAIAARAAALALPVVADDDERTPSAEPVPASAPPARRCARLCVWRT